MTTMRLEGVESYRAQISHLTPKQQRRLWRDALTGTGNTVIKASARRNLRALGYRRLVKALSTRASVQQAKGRVSVAARKRTRLSRIGHLIEHGTKPHMIQVRRKQVLARGHAIFGVRAMHPGTPARPWLEPALLDHAQEVMDDIARRVIANVEKAKTYRAK